MKYNFSAEKNISFIKLAINSLLIPNVINLMLISQVYHNYKS